MLERQSFEETEAASRRMDRPNPKLRKEIREATTLTEQQREKLLAGFLYLRLEGDCPCAARRIRVPSVVRERDRNPPQLNRRTHASVGASDGEFVAQSVPRVVGNATRPAPQTQGGSTRGWGSVLGEPTAESDTDVDDARSVAVRTRYSGKPAFRQRPRPIRIGACMSRNSIPGEVSVYCQSPARRGDCEFQRSSYRRTGCRSQLRSSRTPQLVEFVIEIARSDSGIRRKLETRFQLKVSDRDLVNETGIAISDATDSTSGK